MTGLAVEIHVRANAAKSPARMLTRVDLVNVILTTLTFATVGTRANAADVDAYSTCSRSNWRSDGLYFEKERMKIRNKRGDVLL